MSTEIKFFRFNASETGFDYSPWCNKLEALLTMTNTKFTLHGTMNNKAPRGKLPYIEVSAEGAVGEKIPDSELAYRELVKRGIAEDLDRDLTEEQRATTVAITALLEKFYTYTIVERYVEHGHRAHLTVLNNS